VDKYRCSTSRFVSGYGFQRYSCDGNCWEKGNRKRRKRQLINISSCGTETPHACHFFPCRRNSRQPSARADNPDNCLTGETTVLCTASVASSTLSIRAIDQFIGSDHLQASTIHYIVDRSIQPLQLALHQSVDSLTFTRWFQCGLQLGDSIVDQIHRRQHLGFNFFPSPSTLAEVLRKAEIHRQHSESLQDHCCRGLLRSRLLNYP